MYILFARDVENNHVIPCEEERDQDFTSHCEDCLMLFMCACGVCDCVCVCVCVCTCAHAQLCPTVTPVGCNLPRLLCPWNFPDKNTGMGCQFLLQGIFLTQGLNPCLLRLLHWQADSLPLHHLGSFFHIYLIYCSMQLIFSVNTQIIWPSNFVPTFHKQVYKGLARNVLSPSSPQPHRPQATPSLEAPSQLWLPPFILSQGLFFPPLRGRRLPASHNLMYTTHTSVDLFTV